MRTKRISPILILWIFACLSCKKDSAGTDKTTFIKSLRSDSSMVVVGNVGFNDHILTVCRSMDQKTEGCIFKINQSGDIIWKKQVPKNNLFLWQVYDLPGSGFATVGFSGPGATYAEICFYNDLGDFLYSKPIYWSLSWSGMYGFTPIQMLKLRTGGYVFAASTNGSFKVLFTNSNLDSASQIQKTIPLPRGTSFSYGSFPRGLCEMSDSSVMITTSFSTNTNFDFNWKTLVFNIDFTGNVKYMKTIGDTLHNETPLVLLPMGNKLFSVTGRMGQTHDGSGVFVNFLNSGMDYGFTCAGEINLLQISSSGDLIGRQGIRNYNANGVILNGRPTADGGYILCGIVDQSTMLSIISPTKIYLMKADASGRFVWSKTYSTIYPSYGVDAVEMPDGSYFITGYEKTFDKQFNPIVIKTDANGNL